MKALTKFITATVAAASIASFAASAQAAQVFASSTWLSAGSNFTWTNNGVTGAGAGGTLVGFSPLIPLPAGGGTFFSFLDPLYSALTFVPVEFNLTATTTSGPAQYNAGSGTYTQDGLNGSFSYKYTGIPTLTFGGFTVATGANLLSGTFTGAWLQGAGSSGSANVTIGNSGLVNFTSDYAVLPAGTGHNEAFAFNLIASPGFGAVPALSPTSSLVNFVAHGDGVFSIPEPGTWALMIMGFGGVGALVRNRRRQAAFA